MPVTYADASPARPVAETLIKAGSVALFSSEENDCLTGMKIRTRQYTRRVGERKAQLTCHVDGDAHTAYDGVGELTRDCQVTTD